MPLELDNSAPRRIQATVAPKPVVFHPVALSNAGAGFIEHFEGCRLEAYNDLHTAENDNPANGNATIGIGHELHAGPLTAADRKLKWSEQQARTQLEKDSEHAASAVSSLVKASLTQQQFDALVSFTFNCGVGALASSSLLRSINAKASSGEIVNDFLMWTHSGGSVVQGLVTRRRAEAALFVHGTYV